MVILPRKVGYTPDFIGPVQRHFSSTTRGENPPPISCGMLKAGDDQLPNPKVPMVPIQ